MDVDVGLIVAGKYELRSLIGAGGMGEVWRARHVGLEQFVALKLLRPDDVETEKVVLRRFEIEAQVAAELSRKSRHIVHVHDVGQADGVAYLAMELLEGETLATAFERGPLDFAMASTIVAQIAEGLDVAHAEGVTHRDLKPGNVFLARDDKQAPLVKLLDFGIARLARRVSPAAPPQKAASPPTKLTLRGLVLGTTEYMSPEQALAEEIDVRADVWSLGVLAFEALTGRCPFSGATPDDTLERICQARARPLVELLPNAPPTLTAFFERAFHRRIEQRFQSARELADAFARAVPQAEPRRTWKRASVFVGAALVSLITIAIVLGARPHAHAQVAVAPVPDVLVASAFVPLPAASPSVATPTVPSVAPPATPSAVRSARVAPSAIAAPSASAPHVDKSAIF